MDNKTTEFYDAVMNGLLNVDDVTEIVGAIPYGDYPYFRKRGCEVMLVNFGREMTKIIRVLPLRFVNRENTITRLK